MSQSENPADSNGIWGQWAKKFGHLHHVVVVVVVIAIVTLLGNSLPASISGAAAAKPNFIVIMTDDMPVSLLEAMPRTQALIGNQGTSFTKAYVETALCCPSRTTFLTGLYAHNHHVTTNDGVVGGYKVFKSLGYETSTFPVALKNAGYNTGLFGKYINNYGGTAIPEGWTRWFGSTSNFRFSYNWGVNDQGVIRKYGTGPENYVTDVLRSKAMEFIDQSVASNKPFFLFFSVSAPHEPAIPADRHLGLFASSTVPRTPAFNEADVSDKPGFLQYPSLTPEQIAERDIHYADSLRSMVAVDEAVEAMYNQLQSLGKLDNTYIIFTSDHGSHFGERRAPEGKQLPYEEDIKVPLMIRGPNVRANYVDSEHLVVNADLAPTILRLAGLTTSPNIDGRAARPLIDQNVALIEPWRNVFPIARWRAPSDNLAPYPDFKGLRTSKYTYVEWANGERELYDTDADPYEINNLATSTVSGYEGLLSQFSTLTAQLASCSGATCRELERQPVPTGVPVATSTTPTTTPPTSTLSVGLIGHWTMDNADINLALPTAEVRDTSGKNHHGNWLNHASTTVTGRLGQAILFDGINDAIDLGAGINIANHSFSISGWVKQSNASVGDNTNDHFLIQGTGASGTTNKVLHVGIRGTGAQSGKVTFAFWNNDINSSAATYNNTDWHHIVATYDATTNQRKLYVDGVLSTSDISPDDYQGSGLMCISRCPSQPPLGGAEFSGAIDEVRIYDRVLLESEVTALFNLST